MFLLFFVYARPLGVGMTLELRMIVQNSKLMKKLWNQFRRSFIPRNSHIASLVALYKACTCSTSHKNNPTFQWHVRMMGTLKGTRSFHQGVEHYESVNFTHLCKSDICMLGYTAKLDIWFRKGFFATVCFKWIWKRNKYKPTSVDGTPRKRLVFLSMGLQLVVWQLEFLSKRFSRVEVKLAYIIRADVFTVHLHIFVYHTYYICKATKQLEFRC